MLFRSPPHTRRTLPNIIDRRTPPTALDAVGVMLDSSGLGKELHRSTPPEGRRQRKDLFETLSGTTNPYKDGRPLGNLWLEQRGIKAGARAVPVAQHISNVHCKVLMHADELLLPTPYGQHYQHPLDHHRHAERDA